MAKRRNSCAKSTRAPAIPEMMKAAAVDRFGSPSALTPHELPVPKPGPDEVLIAIDTAGIGSWDGSIRDGSWRKPGRTRFPLVPGVDGAGIVVAKGARVRRVRVGDSVYAYEFGLDFVRLKGRVVYPNGIEPVPAERPTFRVRDYDAVASPRAFDKLNRHLANGKTRVPIAASYPLGRAAQAHRRLERGRVLGRLVLQIGQRRRSRSASAS